MITIAKFYTYCEKQNDRPRVEWYECEKTSECPLYQKGKCACYNFFITSFTCPNARFHCKTGPTKRAKSFYSWIEEYKENIKNTAEEETKKLSKVAGYYFLPMPFLVGAANQLDDVIEKHFVDEKIFDEDFIQKVVKFRPMAWFGNSVIRDYPQEHVPKFVQQLKEEFPELYEKWKEKYPETAEQFADISPVGRTVYISSLPDGCKVKDRNGEFTKKGNKLFCENYNSAFNPFNSKEVYVELEITEKMTTEVTEQMDVGDNAVFVD